MITALILVALASTYLRIERVRQRRHAARDPLAGVFRPGELREFDAHLDEIAAAQLHQMDADVVRYVAGDAGHVVVVSNQRHGGIALALSDGYRLTLSVVSWAARKELLQRAGRDKLRPASIQRNALSYLLLLRGETGVELEIHARTVVLTS
jgi:hypothetical protein